jgi:hypothetical protein
VSASLKRREPDADAIASFVRALFAYADDGSFVSLRAFDQFTEGVPPPYIVGAKINGAGLNSVIDAAVAGARFAANYSDALVFAPPICTFRHANKAAESDLVNGISISVELDSGNTTGARERLEGLLGPATVVVESGGEWIEPETGEIFAKLHLHWRLSEPTREAADHAALKHARRLACALVNADPTAKTSVHPLRWPGSWHLKATPNLAKITSYDSAAEAHLPEAIEALEVAAEKAGLKHEGMDGSASSGTPQADIELIKAALATIPNTDEHWDEWTRIGMMLYRATGASQDGLDAWCTWSEKSRKFVAGACEDRWSHFAMSPPTRIGAGTLFMMARAAGWQRPKPTPKSERPTADAAVDHAVADTLSAIAWAALSIKADVRLLGHVITSTTRAFLVGATGLGKTLMAYGMVGGMATGRGFLHWTCDRPSRWLIIDGEMPSALVKTRADDMIRRAGRDRVPPHGIMIYSRDRAEQFAEAFPDLGQMQPLNTEAGHNFITALIAAVGGVDGVLFDNLMSLAPGDQKDEEIWASCIPLVEALSRRGIAQLWCDHTGHNSARQYGSSTKSWRFDSVGVLTPLSDEPKDPREVAFALSFDYPGKARRRTPSNWQDFSPCTVRLRDDAWSSALAGNSATPSKLSPLAQQFYRSFGDAMAATTTPGRTTRAAWYAEAVRSGLADTVEANDDYRTKDAKQSKFRKYLIEIRTAGLIGVDGETVRDLRNRA